MKYQSIVFPVELSMNTFVKISVRSSSDSFRQNVLKEVWLFPMSAVRIHAFLPFVVTVFRLFDKMEGVLRITNQMF